MEVFYLMQILDALPMAIVAKFLVVLWAKKLEIFYFKWSYPITFKGIDKAFSKNVFLKYEQSMKALQLRKRNLRICTKVYV